MNRTPEQLLAEEIIKASSPGELRMTVFQLADAYANAGLSISQTNVFSAGPIITCLSFAVELLLKFFIINDQPRGVTFQQIKDEGKFQSIKNPKRGVHAYSELFDKISTVAQVKISRQYSLMSGVETDIDGFKEALVSEGEEPFVKWRYIYEQPHGVVTHINLGKFVQVLQSLGMAASAELNADSNS